MTDLCNIKELKTPDLNKMAVSILLEIIKKEMGADYDILEKYNDDVITNNYGYSFMKVRHGRDEEYWEDFCDDPFVAILYDAVNIIRYGKLLKHDEYNNWYNELKREEI